MRIPDLVFLLSVLTTIVVAIRVAWHLLRGQRATARRLGVRWSLGAVCYFAVLFTMSLLQPGRSLPPGETECFDDWCIAVDGLDRASTPRITVAVRISNRGRGRPQAEPDAYVYLVDDSGHKLPATPSAPSEVTIGGSVRAGDSRTVRVAFDIPANLVACGLVKARRSRFPASIIIGDPSSLFHRPTVHLLPAPPVK